MLPVQLAFYSISIMQRMSINGEEINLQKAVEQLVSLQQTILPLCLSFGNLFTTTFDVGSVTVFKEQSAGPLGRPGEEALGDSAGERMAAARTAMERTIAGMNFILIKRDFAIRKRTEKIRVLKRLVIRQASEC